MKALTSLLCLLLPFGGTLSADSISFHADTMRAELARGKERTVLAGNAELVADDLMIQADIIELYGEDFIFALCTGNVKVSNEKKGLEIVSDKLLYNRRDKIARIQGNAVLEDRENELVIKGGIIENRDKEDIVLIQIGVRILKEDLICRPQMARYFRQEQKLELSGMPFVLWRDDEYRATKIFVNLEKDEVQMEGDVQAQVNYKDQQTQEEEQAGQTDQ